MHLLKQPGYLVWLMMSIAMGCQLQGKGPVDPDKKDVTRRDLYSMLREQQKILLVDNWENSQFGDSLRRLVNDFHHPRWQLLVKNSAQVTREELAATPTVLIGAPAQNKWLDLIIHRLPFAFSNEQIVLSEKRFDADQHALMLSYYPNPLNVKMPLGVFTSNNESRIWELANQYITGMFRSSWNYQVVRDGKKIVLGNFSQDPESRWDWDPEQQLSLPGDVVHEWHSGPFLFKSFHQDLNVSSMSDLTVTCNNEVTALAQLIGQALPDTTIAYYIYPSTEIKGLMTGVTDQSHVDFKGREVHTAFDKHLSERYPGKENQLMLRMLLGKPSRQVLEIGLSVYLNPRWQQYGATYWAGHLTNSVGELTMEQLLSPEQFSSMSILVRESLAGSLCHFLLEYWGEQQFLERYHSWSPEREELDELTVQWKGWLSSQHLPASTTAARDFKFLQGFNFTHEGYQIYNGYGSLLSASSLEMVSQLGSNAVAIVPYSWMSDPKKPAAFRFSQRPGSENDEGVIHAIRNAQAQGLFTMLKPHVWIRGSWPGEVDMASAADWDLFFTHYYQWISHYALMAEMYNVDAFCIGVEFSRATISQEQRWRELINKVRSIYSGKITYAANWGDEFEGIKFWDQLDFIGLNCYYPLSRQQSPTVQDLEQGFTEILEKVNRVKSKYQIPVVFTEIGFRSVTSPWDQPHAEAGEKPFNEVHQALCYQAVFQAMAQTPTVDGILWWKWPTDPRLQSEEDRRFVPTGKKAQQVVEQWFSAKK